MVTTKNIIHYESDQSSFSDVQNLNNFSKKQLLFDGDNNIPLYNANFEEGLDLIPLNTEHQNTSNIVVEEAVNVGIEGIRPVRKINEHALKKIEKSKGVGKMLQPNPYSREKCQNKCAKKFTEDERQMIFSEFWKLADPVRQKDYLLNCVSEISIKRKRVFESNKRNITKEYSLPFKNDRTQICLQFLLSTLNITKKFFRDTLENALFPRISKLDQRGKHEPKNKTSDEIMKNIDKFIQKLPAVKSHYCRASSKKKYLPAEMENLTRLYEVYKFHCAQNGIQIAGKSVFRTIFIKKYNIGFHYPKKDKCRFCCKYEDIERTRELNEVEQKLKQIHEEEKNDVKEMFLFDQELSKAGGDFICASFDLQKALNTPQG